MAVTIQSVTPAAYDPTLDFKSELELLGLAVGGNIGASNRVTRDGCDFLVQARSTAAEGPTTVIELMTARSVPFPANFMRVLDIEFWVTGDNANERGYGRHVQSITGGTTPVVNATILTQGSTAGTAGQVPGNFVSAVAGAGLAATPAVSVAAGAGTVSVQITSAEAEILNWTVRVRLGRLMPFIAGV